MKEKKSQAAVEFLMTYGWAILAAIIVIGILGYYYYSSDILTTTSEDIDFNCLGKQFCKDINLEFKRAEIYNEKIICKGDLDDLFETEYEFKIINKTAVIEKYESCKI